MFRIVQQNTPYTPEIGDVGVYGNFDRYIRELTQEEFDKHLKGSTMMPLMWPSPDTWLTLRRLNFEYGHVHALSQACLNECAYFGQTYYALLPMYLMARNPSIYFQHHECKPPYEDIMCDTDWNLSQWKAEKDIPRMAQVAMGSGYNAGIHLNDGSCSKKTVAMDVDTGDTIACLVWEWYNK